ncbi:hypothetical protein A4G28_07535 [Mycobacterium ostraviense]|uniref:Uncharacterized protein n=1 Tax=Mycobacterium ostraviense TaxID=2738409 RepID=A0A164C5C2_9MYCO|nr:hypothetical protein A4G28_07535 [Mycobacterium ostraviense]
MGPIIVAVALMYGLGLFYVGGTLNPGANLRHIPVAIVNQDAGPTGRLIADGLAANMDKNQFDIRVLPADQARDQLETGKVYAQVLLPWDLSQRLFVLPAATLQPGQPLKPVITISTGPRAGVVAAVIAEKAMRKALGASTPGPAPCSARNYDGKATAHRCREPPCWCWPARSTSRPPRPSLLTTIRCCW